MSHSRAIHGAAAVLIVALTGALYANSLDAPFVFDDTQNIVENHHIRITSLDPASLWDAAFDAPNPRPVANLSFALDYYFGGYAVRGYHLVNVAIHALNGLLVYALCLLLLGHAKGPDADPLDPRHAAALSLLGALFFVAHPIQTQSVTYVVQRMASLAACFYLAGFLAYLLGRSRTAGPGRLALFALCAVSALLGVASKQNAATLPVAILLAEWLFFRDLDVAWLRRQRWLVPCLVLLAAAAAAYLVRSDPFSGYQKRDFTLAERLLTQPRVVLFYLSLVLLPLPSRQSLTHAFATSTSLFHPVTTLPALLALAGLLVAALVAAPRRRLLSFGILWVFLNLAIESSVFPLEMAYEHRMYLPMVGVVLAGLAEPARVRRARQPATLALGALAIAALGFLTVQRNEIWRDDVTLWRDVVQKSPHDYRALNNLGRALDRRGSRAEAEKLFAAAVEARPDYARGHHNLARVLHEQGRFEDAIHEYTEALRLEPDDAVAMRDLGLALEQAGRLDDAIRELRASVRIAPGSAQGHYVLGNLLMRHGRPAEAVPELAEATRLSPRHLEAQRDLGLARAASGDLAGAVGPLSRAVRLAPSSAETHFALGSVYLGLGLREDARAQLAEAVRLRPDFAAARAALQQLAAPTPRATGRPE